MDKGTKIALIVTASVVGAIGLGFGIAYLVKKFGGSPDSDLLEDNPFLETGSAPGMTEPSGSQVDNTYTPLIGPKFNVEGELDNSIQMLKGRKLYPKTKAKGGWDYSNVRSSAEVNTDQGWWDTGNKITTIYKGNSIGKVLSDTTGVYNDYPYRWFKVKLTIPTGGYTEGYVRADTVTIQSQF